MSRAVLAAYLVFIGLLGATVLLVGPVTQMTFSHDFFTLMEGGWKITQGYRPYTDFHTLIGPIPYLIVAGGILVAGAVASAMLVSVVLTLLPVSAVIWYLLSSRLTKRATFLAATYLALLWCAPYPLHFTAYQHSYAMSYNRQSYVLLCLLFLSTAVRPRDNLYLKGVLLGLLFYFKLPYCIVGFGFLGFYLFFSGISRREILRATGGFLTAFLPVFVYLGGQGTVQMFLFMLDAGQNRTPDVTAQNLGLMWHEFPVAIPLVLLLAVCSRWTECRFRPGTAYLPSSWWARTQLLAEPFVVLVGAFLTETASCPLFTVSDVPLICVYTLLLLDRAFRTASWAGWRVHWRVTAPTLALGLAMSFLMAVRPWAGMASIVCFKLFPLGYPGTVQIAAPAMEGLRMFDRCGDYPPNVSYPDKVNDGISLIHKHPELDQSAIATLDFSDPFSFSLRRHSPPHMPVALQYGFDVTEKIGPNPQRIFDGCQAIMVPKYPDDPGQTIAILRPRYDSYLTQHFVVLDQSAEWTLLKRNVSTP